MDQKMKQKLDLFTANNKVLLKKYWAHSTALSMLASSIYTQNGKTVDLDELKNCEKILRKNFGIFSNMRGLLSISLLAQMANKADPEGYIQQVGKLYKDLTAGKLFTSEYDVLCASILHDFQGQVNAEQIKEKMKSIYQRMGKKHPLLTSWEDKPTAMMLALTGKGEEELMAEMENCYGLLKPHFSLRGEQVQTMSALLSAQEGSAKEKCDWVLSLCDELKNRKYSVNFSYALPIVAGLRSSGKSAGEVADAVAEIADALKGTPGFGLFGTGKEGRVAFAMLLYMNELAQNGEIGHLMGAALTSIIIYEIILAIVIITIIAANNSTSSSSN